MTTGPDTATWAKAFHDSLWDLCRQYPDCVHTMEGPEWKYPVEAAFTLHAQVVAELERERD
jgi:hypothetical protein